MQQTNEVMQYDVVIVGAGPAGCSCALAMKDAGLSVVLLDKSSFPRDKVCGDAIPGRAVKTLGSISPVFEEAFKQFPQKEETKKTTLHYKGRQLTFSWVKPAYTCTRMAFDNFLFNLVKEHTGTEILTQTQPEQITINDDGVTVTLKNAGAVIKAKMIVGADGAHSVVAKQLTDRTLDRKHHVGSVRAYYLNVGSCDADTTEIYFSRQFLPSYLWVFPLPGNMTNVGFGMLSSEIARRKINIKKTFYDFIAQTPVLQSKFAEAKQEGTLDGFGLPLGSAIGQLSGNRFMLAGDAASLIDPISGDGIGNSMLSGRLAAMQAIRCFKEPDFSADTMKQYDDSVHNALGAELKARHRAQLLLSRFPFLLDIVFLGGKSKWLKKMIQKRL